MWVRLTRRLATCIDGVNLSARQIGDVFEVPRHDGELLIAEAWAVQATNWRFISLAEQLRNIRRQIERRFIQSHEQRRAEDRIRDEWHDDHARPIG